MLLATWNVNSIKARLDRLLAWLDQRRPDVACLQELKVPDPAFPIEAIREAGYHAVFTGQKTYNGVAILSRSEPSDVVRGLGDDVDDPQARFVAATVEGVRVLSVYVPNGGALGSDKCAYKLDWLRRLRAWLDRHASPDAPLAVCGDFNVAPEPRDVHDPGAWQDTVLFHPDMRAALAGVAGFGLKDALRLVRDDAGIYSWWDYRMLGFPKNRGLRIDHVFVTAPLAERCREVFVDRDQRKGKQPSDHAPVVARFE